MIQAAKLLIVITAVLLLVHNTAISSSTPKYPIEMYPSSVATDCRGGIANVYDECSDQSIILEKAVQKANKTGKSVLVVYGAEWCIWCHVFDKYIKGQSRHFDYQWEYENELQGWEMREKENTNAKTEAEKLNKYVSDNFVVAHIEGYYSPNGEQVITNVGVDADKLQYVPFIFVLDKNGRYVGHMPSSSTVKGLEIREDSGKEYRGYDRKILLNELKKLRNLALSST